MKIITLLSVFAPGDAVSNDALAIHRFLTKHGFHTVMAAEKIYYQPEGTSIIAAGELSFIESEDTVIYHLSTGTKLNYLFGRVKCKKVIRYHNVTPPEFFYGYSNFKVASALEGIRGAAFLADKADLCVCVSEFNKNDLIQMGYHCPMEVVPILIPFEDYDKEPDEELVKQLQTGGKNIIFTGRIVPNKRQEDIIVAFYYYQKYYDDTARLHLVGNYVGFENYYQKLQDYVKRLGVRHVNFTGHVSFAQILAYYKGAQLFLCMSDHEGFCVPLVEAMKFDVPIVAKNTTAIASTMNGAGILVNDRSPEQIAGIMHQVLTNDELRKRMISNGKERLKDFDHDIIGKRWLELF